MKIKMSKTKKLESERLNESFDFHIKNIEQRIKNNDPDSKYEADLLRILKEIQNSENKYYIYGYLGSILDKRRQ